MSTHNISFGLEIRKKCNVTSNKYTSFFIVTARAEAYKDDGNSEFQKKQYRIAVDNYTEGIKCRCPDRSLNAILYTNRAASQFHIGNIIIVVGESLASNSLKYQLTQSLMDYNLRYTA